jgi:acetyl-CoA carboxylase biotin carboxyl carrier protein
MIDLEWIRELVELVDESGVDSLEISRFGTSVKIRKSPPGGAGDGERVSVVAPGSAGAGAPAPGGAPSGGPGTGTPAGTPAAPPAEEPEPAAEEPGEDAAGGEDLHEVESPMVGTFYRAPAPDAPPYVEVGDRVEKGQTLCILEAMKLMNELEAEVAGEIREICVQNAEPVEYGQVLFRIDTG